MRFNVAFTPITSTQDRRNSTAFTRSGLAPSPCANVSLCTAQPRPAPNGCHKLCASRSAFPRPRPRGAGRSSVNFKILVRPKSQMVQRTAAVCALRSCLVWHGGFQITQSAPHPTTGTFLILKWQVGSHAYITHTDTHISSSVLLGIFQDIEGHLVPACEDF